MLFSSMSRMTSGLTGRRSPSISFDRAEAELGEQGQAHAEQRRHQRAVDLEALAEEPGEVAGREQHQRAAAERGDQQAVEQEPDREAADGAGHACRRAGRATTTRAGSTSGLTWKRATWEKKESCRSTPTHDDRDQAGDDVRGEDHPREPPVRTWTRSRLRRSA